MALRTNQADEIDEIPETAQQVLRAMQRFDGEVKSKTIGDMTQSESDLARYHIREHLVPGGWVEHAGEKDEGYPQPTKYYRLTSKGRSVNPNVTIPASVDDLRDQLNDLKAQYQQLRSDHERLKESHNNLVDRLSNEH